MHKHENHTLGKVFIPLVKFLVLLMSLLLTYRAHGATGNLNNLYRIQTVAVLPFVDTSKINMENFVKDEIRRILLEDNTLFELIDDKKVEDTVRKLKLMKKKSFGREDLILLKNNLKSDGIFYGTIMKLGSKLKIVIKFKNIKTMEDLSATTINIDGWYSPESIKDDIKKGIEKMLVGFPYKGIVTNANGESIIMRIDVRTFNKANSYVRLVTLTNVQKNPLVKERIIGFTKEEIGVIEVLEVNPPLLIGKLRYIKPEYNLSTSQLIDFEETGLAQYITEDEIPPVAVASAQADEDIVLERIDDNQSENVVDAEQKNNASDEIEEGGQAQSKPVTLDEIDKEYDSEFMIKEGQAQQEEPKEETKSSFVVTNKEDNRILGRRLLWEKKKPTYSLDVGIITGVSFNTYVLESNGVDIPKGGVKTNGIYDFGLSSSFFLRKYFGFDFEFTQGLLKNKVDISIEEPETILVSRRTLKFNLIGRWHILGKNPLSPYADLRLGYGYFKIDFDEIRTDDDEFAYLASQLYHGAIATALIGFPILENRLSLEANFSYWLFPFTKESPDGASGADPLANAYSFGASSLVNVYKAVSVRVGYEYEFFHVDYLGTGSRFLEEVKKADAYDTYHTIFLSVLYKFL